MCILLLLIITIIIIISLLFTVQYASLSRSTVGNVSHVGQKATLTFSNLNEFEISVESIVRDDAAAGRGDSEVTPTVLADPELLPTYCIGVD